MRAAAPDCGGVPGSAALPAGRLPALRGDLVGAAAGGRQSTLAKVPVRSAMDLRAFDLNLLVVFDALFRHRGVTAGAQAIGLSQPAMSAALARLRSLFGD